ncbi:Vitamin B12-binding protein [Acaryochloris thomasi RCC1774]|uniref:Vitamin B12-binding protein n=1 Tax=Acaryochloris thomasi RCC1774 TaxID=1764569 RepID=A0A2W1JVS6_9CYAN|nr:cobalamin-binding protein [Acaryochloris thomasi]PZD72557.1 Vitamin B12-binding protein [Acaryochloris thomasi RCC1774]
MAELRIVSLIPSATEIVAALGLVDCLVGRSHECDAPPAVESLPVCTAPNLDPQGSSREIHDRVEDLLQAALSIYRIDLEQLEQLRPTHVITQAQCDVCAVSLSEVEDAVAQLTNHSPQIISLQPQILGDVWQDIRRVAAALGVDATPLLSALQARLDVCQNRTYASRPGVACIEWTDPLMAAGNWVPELVEIAGGKNLLGQTGQHSPWLTWDALVAANPDVMVLMPCGFDLEQTRRAAQDMIQHPHWGKLKAVQAQQVFLADGNQYFNRPGPRLVDSAELLCEIFHPEPVSVYGGQGWERL